MACEVGHCVSKHGIKRDDANDFLRKILQKYENKLLEAPIGKSFSECYDLKKITPQEEYINIYAYPPAPG